MDKSSKTMAWMNRAVSLIAFSLALSLDILWMPSLLATEPAQTQAFRLNQQLPRQQQAKSRYQPPVGIGAPRRIQGAATRGGCLTNGTEQLTALLPDNSFSPTVAQSPTFFAYVPASTGQQVHFTLTDSNQNPIYQTSLSLTGKAEIVSVSVPATAASSLQTDNYYIVSFTLNCDPDDSSGDLVAGGIIQPVALSQDLQREIAQALPRRLPLIYANEHLWLESLASLAQLRHQHPNDLSLIMDWNSLLRSLGLGEIAQVPLMTASSK